MLRWLLPKEPLGQSDVDHGLRMLLIDGLLGQTMIVLAGGAFLVAFALLLGASNRVIGFVAAIGPMAQVLQLPAVFLVDKVRARKLLVVIACILSRLCLVAVALVPFFFPPGVRLTAFFGFLFLFFAIGAVSGCAFNSWVRDLVPDAMMGKYFARRMALSIGTGAVLSLAAAVGVDFFQGRLPEEFHVYMILFGIAAAFGFVDVYFLGRIPEPRMALGDQKGILSMLIEPFRNERFRQLLFFLGSWHFAVMFAAPFFTVYLLRRLGLSMTWVIGLAVLSQLVNVAFLGIWGKLSDRFGNKSILLVAGPAFLISIALWPFTTLPEKHMFTVPLLILIHSLAGMSTAGVVLSAGTIALKAAPKGAATAYLATNALVAGTASTLAPILAGFAGDWFATRRLSLDLTWATGDSEFVLPAIHLQGLDFLFICSFVLGLYAVHRLLTVKEQGEVEERVVIGELYAEVRKTARDVSNVAGLRQVAMFPFDLLRGTVGTVSRLVPGGGPPEATEPPPADSETDGEGSPPGGAGVDPPPPA